MENSRLITVTFVDLVRVLLTELVLRFSVLTAAAAESGWTPDQTDMCVVSELYRLNR